MIVSSNTPQTWNRYAYVGNTPLVATDPLGLIWACVGTAESGTDLGTGCTWFPDPPTYGVGSGQGGGIQPGPCIVENRPGSGLSDTVNGLAAGDGPSDPGVNGDGCGRDRSVGARRGSVRW